jgi:hypothetical protein
MINKRQRNVPRSEEIEEAVVYPVFVPELNRVGGAAGKLIQELRQPGKEILGQGKSLFIEVRELKQQGPELVAKEVHRLQEL